jgi:hypothetical protein
VQIVVTSANQSRGKLDLSEFLAHFSRKLTLLSDIEQTDWLAAEIIKNLEMS